MDIYAIRKARLLRLIELEFDGSKRRFADKVKLGQTPEGSRTKVHRWLPKSPAAASRNIEYASARHIEEQLDLLPMSLDHADLAAPYRDTPHNAGQKPNEILPLGYSRRTGNRPNTLMRELGIKDALFTCEACGGVSAYTLDP